MFPVIGEVVIRNVVVEESCELTSGADGAILVGYIGSAETTGKLKGSILFENCEVSGKIVSNYIPIGGYTSAYGPVGGLIGFTCRADYVNITIRDCTVNGTIDGQTIVGAAIGNVQSLTSLKFEGKKLLLRC